MSTLKNREFAVVESQTVDILCTRRIYFMCSIQGGRYEQHGVQCDES